MRARPLAWAGVLAMALGGLNVSCVGDIGDGDAEDGGPGSGQSGPADAEFAAMRRMTPIQYESTMRDLVGDPGLELDLDADAGQVITLLAVDKLNRAAEAIVARRASWTLPVFPCDTTGQEDLACVDEFIRTFGRRAYRRTLTEDDVALLQADYERARLSVDFNASMEALLQTILQSPEVYYFLERGREPGEDDDLADGVFPLTGWERASRLSYFLWGTMPDDALLDAAESGALDTSEGVRKEAERLLADPRARRTLVRFFADWLELDGSNKHSSLLDAPKSTDIFPEDSPSLRAAMRTETEALVERVLVDGDGRLETLLTTTDAYVDAELAAIYGVEGPANPGEFAWVTLPADQRAGLFTRAAFLTVFAGNEVKSPIRRGAYLLEEVMCSPLGPPPPNASDVPVKGGDAPDGPRTIRQDVEAKTASTVCNACHSTINPIGFTFDNYDAMGRWQAQETGVGESGEYSLDIDVSGGLPALGDDAPVSVNGPIEMSAALASSGSVRECLTQHLFETALRRLPIDRDLASVDAAIPTVESGGTVRDAVIALTVSNAFLNMRRDQE